MCCVDIDDVEARALGADRRVLVPAAQVFDIGRIHRPRLHRIIIESGDRQMRGAERHFAGIVVGPVGAVVRKFNPRQGILGMDRVAHLGQRRDVAIIPQPQFDEGRDLRRVMDLGLFGAQDSPATSRLVAAHPGHGRGVAITLAVAMRHLIEAVLRGDGTDLYGLEQNIVTRITRHFKVRLECGPTSGQAAG